MFAKFHNTLQDSSYESRKKERKITNKISNRLFRLDHALQLIFAPSSRRQCTFPNCYVAHIAIYNKVAGKVLVASRTKESAAWIGCPVWETVDTDRSCRSDRTIEASCPREVEQTHPESTVHPLETDPCWLVSASVDPPCFTFPRSSCLSLSLSTRSLSSLPILARVCSHHCQSKDANERDPSSSNNLFPSWSSRNPRHTISYVPWWIPSLLASCESRGIEARTRLSDPDGQVVGPTTSRSRPGRGPTVASGPQQHLWSGLLRGPIWDSSPRSSCNNVDTDPSSFSSFSFSPLFLGLFAPGSRQRILEFKLDASGPNRPDSDTPLILKSSFLPLYGSDLWLSTGIPLQGKLISVQPFFFYVTFVIRRTSGLLDRLQMRSLVLDNESRECRIVSEVWWKRVILRPWPRSSIPMDARTELRRLSTIKLLQLA